MKRYLYHFFFLYHKGGKQACGPPDGKQPPQPIDACNTGHKVRCHTRVAYPTKWSPLLFPPSCHSQKIPLRNSPGKAADGKSRRWEKQGTRSSSNNPKNPKNRIFKGFCLISLVRVRINCGRAGGASKHISSRISRQLAELSRSKLVFVF